MKESFWQYWLCKVNPQIDWPQRKLHLHKLLIEKMILEKKTCDIFLQEQKLSEPYGCKQLGDCHIMVAMI